MTLIELTKTLFEIIDELFNLIDILLANRQVSIEVRQAIKRCAFKVDNFKQRFDIAIRGLENENSDLDDSPE